MTWTTTSIDALEERLPWARKWLAPGAVAVGIGDVQEPA
jgi:hypothetical protein